MQTWITNKPFSMEDASAASISNDDHQDKDNSKTKFLIQCNCGCGRKFTDKRLLHVHNRNIKLREKRKTLVLNASSKGIKRIQDEVLSCAICTLGYHTQGATVH